MIFDEETWNPSLPSKIGKAFCAFWSKNTWPIDIWEARYLVDTSYE